MSQPSERRNVNLNVEMSTCSQGSGGKPRALQPGEHGSLLLKSLSRVGAPKRVMQLVFLLATMNLDLRPQIDTLETFAGKEAFSKAAREAGFQAASYEKDNDPENQNILTDQGFIFLLYLAIIQKFGGQAMHAIVCSSWGMINKGTSKRSGIRGHDSDQGEGG